jgi:hypothetical protein
MMDLPQNLSTRKIKLGALYTVPGELVKDPNGLLKSLTFPNPEYRNAQMFAKARSKSGHVYTKIPKSLFFYGLNKVSREIMLPRNIDLSKYLHKGYEIEDCTSVGKPLSPYSNPTFELRDYQASFIDDQFVPAFTKDCETDFLVIAPCGAGKTVTGLYAASLLKRRMLVVCTTNQIAKQWGEAVKDIYTGWTYNKITGANTDTDVDVTIATYALLSDPKYDAAFFSQFGTIIFDEYHRAGADSYNEILKKAVCKYRISLTATFRRKDNLHKVLALHVGTKLEMDAKMMKARVFPTLTNTTVVLENFRAVKHRTFSKLVPFTDVVVMKDGEVVTRGVIYDLDKNSKLVDVDGTWYDTREYQFGKLGEVSFAEVENYLATVPSRKADLVRLIYWGRKNGRNILLLSNRKSLLYGLYRMLHKKMKVGVIVSEKAKEQQKFCRALNIPVKDYEAMVKKDCTVILGIDKIAKEGMDIARLDMLIYAYAEADIEQSVGRICRNVEGKPEPIAFYVLDDSPVHEARFYNKGKGAKDMFLDLGHTVENEIRAENINDLVL